MSQKDNSILQEQIQDRLENRRKPLKREKQEFSIIAAFGAILFLITVIVTLVMQLGHFFK